MPNDKTEPGIDHECADEIVCPNCGYTETDSWERDDSGADECGECGSSFRWERHTSVHYSTEKVTEVPDAR